MFETRFALRRPKRPIYPKGPTIPSKANVRFNLGVANLKLKLPRNRSTQKPMPQNPVQTSSLDRLNYDNLVGGSNKWFRSGIISRAWDFYGDGFTGTAAYLNFGLSIIKRSRPFEESSFFHPRVFEMAIAEVLEELYFTNLDKENNQQSHFSPVNWSPIKKYLNVASSFLVIPNKSVNVEDPIKIFAAPITSTHLIWMRFSISRRNAYYISDKPENINIDDWIKLDNIYEFISTILESFECELIGSSKDESHKILAELGNKSLVENYPPLRWIDNEAEFATAIKAIPKATE